MGETAGSHSHGVSSANLVIGKQYGCVQIAFRHSHNGEAIARAVAIPCLYSNQAGIMYMDKTTSHDLKSRGDLHHVSLER